MPKKRLSRPLILAPLAQLPAARPNSAALWFWRSEAGAVSVEWIVLSGLMFAFVTLAINSLAAAVSAMNINL